MIELFTEYDDHPSNEQNVQEIVEYIDNEFYYEAIQEQITEGLDSNNTNYLDQLFMKLEEIKQKYDESDYEQILMFMDSLYRDMIDWIEGKYGIEIVYDSDSDIESITIKLYNFFVIEMKKIATSFLLNYMVENYDALVTSLPEDRLDMRMLNKREVLPEDRSKYIAAGNIEMMITQISLLDNDFDTFIKYAARSSDIEALNETDEEGNIQLSWSIVDEGNIVQDVLKQIADGEYDRNIITSITDNLISSLNINPINEEDN